MKVTKIGLILLLAGGLLVFGFSWVAPWWTSQGWSSAPPEHCEGTNWAAFGPVFMLLAFSVPIGVILFVIGLLLYTRFGKTSAWLVMIIVTLAILGMLYPPTMAYYPIVFGIGGGFILSFFFLTIVYWAKNRRRNKNENLIATDFQLISYIFFLLTAINLCALVGNPFSGLYFPEKVLRDESLPFLYSIGLKVIIYFVLAWLFTFLSQYKNSSGSKDNGN